MNIFYLDESLIKNAQAHCDTHLRKMIVEHCQMLANAFTVSELEHAPLTQKGTIRKHSYINHPCSKWVCDSFSNWSTLFLLTCSMLDEYEYRFEKQHYCKQFIEWCKTKLRTMALRLGHKDFTQPPQCMPEQYKHENTVSAYRNYYIFEKAYYIHKGKKKPIKWTKRNKPKWFKKVK